MASPLAQYQQAMADQSRASAQLIGQQTQGAVLTNGQINANAAADQAARYASAGLAGAQARSINANTPSEIAARYASAGLAGAQAGSIAANTPSEVAARDATTAQVAANSGADRQARLAQAGLATTQAGSITSNDALTQALQRLKLGTMVDNPLDGSTPGASAVPFVQGFATGTSRVTAGKSKPKATDHIPALLSDGEAVLNRGAAEHMGRGVIDHLNGLGMMRMAAQHEVSKHLAGLAQHKAKGGKPKPGTIGHFLTGTGNVMAPAGAPAGGGGMDLSSLMGGAGSGPAGGGDPLSSMLASLGGAAQGQGGASAGASAGGPPSPGPKSPSRHHKRR